MILSISSIYYLYNYIFTFLYWFAASGYTQMHSVYMVSFKICYFFFLFVTPKNNFAQLQICSCL